MNINIRVEEEKDYRIVEEITRAAFSYPDRIKRGKNQIFITMSLIAI